ncbi:hypothetical protein F5B18DRAFT_655649 [Nemania serpens]|nr:hypothetical protein F5B18DRAFT_655649 [Nemania serpens]
MSSVKVDFMSLPSIRDTLPELISDVGIKKLQCFKATQQLGETLGYFPLYHEKDVPKTMLHPGLRELDAWRKEAWKQGRTDFPDNIENCAIRPYSKLESHVAAQGDQGQLHLHAARNDPRQELKLLQIKAQISGQLAILCQYVLYVQAIT